MKRTGPCTDDAAERLFREFLATLPFVPQRIEVDLRLEELQDAEFFGEFEHRSLIAREGDPLDSIRTRSGPVKVALAPDIEALIRDVVRDANWFSLGAYGIVLDDKVLVDRMHDGVVLEAVERTH